ncbi:MAG: hypothetical protein NTZ94_16690 [Verrucomicrobia bacterium]|nr:hypothetical protein [Verrucomicrobiota bacterium]
MLVVVPLLLMLNYSCTKVGLIKGGIVAAPLAYRTADRPVRGARGGSVVTTEEALKAHSRERDRVQECSTEQHNRSLDPFTLHVFEFNDRGELHRPVEAARMLSEIGEESARNGALIVVFAHGWQHSSDVCDQNLVCVRQHLRVLAQQENSILGVPRRVVGVFLGWRGYESVRVEGYRRMDFLGRMKAANRIGSTGGRTLLKSLAQIRAAPIAEKNKTAMITVGHSYGGALVFAAIREEIITSIRAKQEMIHGVGDLTILVNPALEAAQYAEIHKGSLLQIYSPQQRPILVTISTRHDWVNGVAFRLAKTIEYPLSTSKPDASRRSSAMTALGHYEPFRTHTIEALRAPTAGEKEPFFTPYLSRSNCYCREVAPTPFTQSEIVEFVMDPQPDFSRPIRFKAARMSPYRSIPSMSPRVPFLNIYTDVDRPGVTGHENVFMRGHGDIFNSVGFGFISEFVVRYIAALL